MVRVNIQVPFLSYEHFKAILFISAESKHVELARTRLESDQSVSRMSPYITSKIGNLTAGFDSCKISARAFMLCSEPTEGSISSLELSGRW